jgi:transcription antitermination factor NusG
MTIAIQALATIRDPMIPASFPVGGRWYVVYTAPQAERRAVDGIMHLGFECFLPMERRVRRKPRVKPQVYEAPLFPRYGFVRFDINRDGWGGILETDGVMDLLRPNNVPVSVPTTIIDGLRLADSIGLLDHTQPPKLGSLVEVTDGPFSGLLGKIMRARSGDRVDVLLKILNGAVRSTFPLSMLREA